MNLERIRKFWGRGLKRKTLSKSNDLWLIKSAWKTHYNIMCSHLQNRWSFWRVMSIWRVDTQIVKKVSIIQTLIWKGKWILIEDLISIMKSLWWELQDGVLEWSFCLTLLWAMKLQEVGHQRIWILGEDFKSLEKISHWDVIPMDTCKNIF